MAMDVKQILSDALMELIQEKPLSKITTTDIIARAGTGRQTFYNYFRDQNDLIHWIFLRTLTGEAQSAEATGFLSYLTKLYREAQKYSSLFAQACAITGQNSLSDAIFQQTYDYYKAYVLKHCTAYTESLEYALIFNAHGASYLYVQWAKAGMPGSAEAQARNALRCMPRCIRDCLPLSPEERAL